jgi:hypothetical protein
MSTHKLIQGDSLWLDITGDVASIDTTWANWRGKWSIVPAIGGIPTHTGDLVKSATVTGSFRLQLSPVESATLALGTHYLIIQVERSVDAFVTVDYRKEIAQDKLVVSVQGITP